MHLIEYFVIATFGVQGLLMLFDEFYFHRKRAVPKFERIGHPIDTFFVLLCFGVVGFLNLNEANILLYILLSILSCICIVKDEAIHKFHCAVHEQFLHALLFLMHPIILFAMFLCWPSTNNKGFEIFLFQSEFLGRIFYLQFILSICFFLYQIIYWNFILKEEYIEKSRTCE